MTQPEVTIYTVHYARVVKGVRSLVQKPVRITEGYSTADVEHFTKILSIVDPYLVKVLGWERKNAPVPVAPTHVVVDVSDGYTYSRDRANRPFTLETATAFADERNGMSKPHARTYRVYALRDA